MSEAAARYINLAEQFGARVDAAPPDSWDAPSPCEGWAARDAVKHVVEGQRRIVAAIRGGDPEPMPGDADPTELWQESFAALKDAVQDESALQNPMVGPMGEMPVEFMLGRIYASDILVHIWDLARAVGGDERLDAEAVAQAFKGLQPMDAMIRQPGVFGPKVEPPDGADEQTQFLCFLGRRP